MQACKLLLAGALMLPLAGCGESGVSQNGSSVSGTDSAAAILAKIIVPAPAPAKPKIPGAIVRADVTSKGVQAVVTTPPKKLSKAYDPTAAGNITRANVDDYDGLVWPFTTDPDPIDPLADPQLHNGQAHGGDSALQHLPVISGDGNWVAFESDATNLDLAVPDTNGATDVFVHDVVNGTTVRIHTSSANHVAAANGEPTGGGSYSPSISRDGAYVSFESDATNLVDGDTKGTRDVFRWCRATGKIDRVSLKADGTEANNFADESSISGDGQRVVFLGRDNQPGFGIGSAGFYVRDYSTTPNTWYIADVANDGVTPPNNGEQNPVISDDGGHVAFTGFCDNLIPTDGPFTEYSPGNPVDVYMRDLPGSRTTVGTDSKNLPDATDNNGYVFKTIAGIRYKYYPSGRTTRVSVNSSGVRGDDQSAFPSISADGRFVAFWSQASNMQDGIASLPRNVDPGGGAPLRSARNIYWRDCLLDTPVPYSTQCCSLTSGNPNATPPVAPSPATNADTQFCNISADGQWVYFTSLASDLNEYAGGEQVYVCNLGAAPKTHAASLSSDTLPAGSNHVPANGGARCGGCSSDGSRFAFTSNGNNLVPNDTNNLFDVFVRENPFVGVKP